jgi:hypothetical protein
MALGVIGPGEHGMGLLELIFQPTDDITPYRHHPMHDDRWGADLPTGLGVQQSIGRP